MPAEIGLWLKQTKPKKTDWKTIWGKCGKKQSRINAAIWSLALRKLLSGYQEKRPRVLGLGSGTGLTSFIIARIVAAEKLTLLDSEEKALAISRSLAAKFGGRLKINYLLKDALELAGGQNFDVVHSEGLIEHFYGRERTTVFEKHVDACRPAGLIIIFVPIKGWAYTLTKAINMLFDNWPYAEEPFSKEEIYRLCRQFNLRVIKEVPFFHQLGLLMRPAAEVARPGS